MIAWEERESIEKSRQMHEYTLDLLRSYQCYMLYISLRLMALRCLAGHHCIQPTIHVGLEIDLDKLSAVGIKPDDRFGATQKRNTSKHPRFQPSL